MITALIHVLTPLLYVRICSERIGVRNVRDGNEINEVPEVAIASQGEKQTCLAFGADARKIASDREFRIVNPFDHSRTLIADFTVGERLLKEMASRVLKGNSFFTASPIFVIHPLVSPKGGLPRLSGARSGNWDLVQVVGRCWCTQAEHYLTRRL